MRFKREWHLFGPDRYDGSLARADMEAILRVARRGGGELALTRLMKKMYELPPEVRLDSWMVEVACTEGGFDNRMARGVVHFPQFRPAMKTPWQASMRKAEQDLNQLLCAEGALRSPHRQVLLTLTAYVVTRRRRVRVARGRPFRKLLVSAFRETAESESPGSPE